MLRWKMPKLGPLGRPFRWTARQLPPLNFITIHYCYFTGTCLLGAVILWGSSTSAHSVPFVDSLFLSVSAMSGAGLNTVNLSTLNTFQQFLLFVLIMLGSAIFVSAFVVHLRKAAFEKKFEDVIEHRRQRGSSRRRGRRGTSSRGAIDDDSEKHNDDAPLGVGSDMLDGTAASGSRLDALGSNELPLCTPEEIPRTGTPGKSPPAVTFSDDTRFPLPSPHASPHRRSLSFLSIHGVGAEPSSSMQMIGPRHRAVSSARSQTSISRPSSRRDETIEFETEGGRVARNSQFHGLTEEERERLGGYEYRAVSLLAWVVPTYYVMWQLLGSLGCAAWVASKRPETARVNGLNPWWVGAFNAVSAFNNSGMSLLDANMTAFQTGYYLLITMSLLILAGNTCYPIFLRWIVWCMYKVAKALESRSEAWQGRARMLRFLLDHPRRCYTNMFPSQHTWWLLLSVVALNGIDWAAFEILNIGNNALNSVLAPAERVIDGLFQAFAIRSGGFYVVSIPLLRISLQVLYVVMMYVAVYPVVITIRNSNVYEERSLGIYADEQAEDEDDNTPARRADTKRPGVLSRISSHLVAGGANGKESNGRFVRHQLRAQLAHDAWSIFLALFAVMIIESGQFERNPINFSVFNVIFEIVSGYGCVGISVGYPGVDYSFCGEWHALSKLILCAIMLRGRHRGLPVAIDKAVMLPGEENWLAEEDDGRIRLARSMSRGRQDAV